MNKQTRFHFPSSLLATLLLGTAGVTHAAPAVSQPFETVVEGSALKPGAEAGKLVSPLPGVAVTVAGGASAALLRAQIAKKGDTILSRDVAFRLDNGTLSFALDKRIVDRTRFEVQTPHGRKSAQGAVGTVAVEGSCVKYASLNGKMMFSASGVGSPVAIKAGSCLTICGEGAQARIHLVDAVARTSTPYSVDGSPLASRAATVAELESARGFFASAVANAVTAQGSGLLGPASVAEIAKVLTVLNQSMTAAGLAAIEGFSGAAPSARRAGFVGGEPAAPGGFGGVPASPANTLGSPVPPANPANISGDVNSPER